MKFKFLLHDIVWCTVRVDTDKFDVWYEELKLAAPCDVAFVNVFAITEVFFVVFPGFFLIPYSASLWRKCWKLFSLSKAFSIIFDEAATKKRDDNFTFFFFSVTRFLSPILRKADKIFCNCFGTIKFLIYIYKFLVLLFGGFYLDIVIIMFCPFRSDKLFL